MDYSLEDSDEPRLNVATQQHLEISETKDSPATVSAGATETTSPVRKLLEVKREVEPDWMRREEIVATSLIKPMDSHHAVYRMSEDDALVYHRSDGESSEFLLYSA